MACALPGLCRLMGRRSAGAGAGRRAFRSRDRARRARSFPPGRGPAPTSGPPAPPPAQSPAGAVERGRRAHIAPAGRTAFPTGVGDFDTQGRGRTGEPQLEVPARDTAVRHGVRRQLGDDQCGGVGRVGAVRHVPGVQLMESQVTGEPGAESRGAEPLREHTYGAQLLGCDGWVHGPTVDATEGAPPDQRLVRCVSVRVHTVGSHSDPPRPWTREVAVHGGQRVRGTGGLGQPEGVRGSDQGFQEESAADTGTVRATGAVFGADGGFDRAGAEVSTGGFRRPGGGGAGHVRNDPGRGAAPVAATGAGELVPAVGAAGDRGGEPVHVRNAA